MLTRVRLPLTASVALIAAASLMSSPHAQDLGKKSGDDARKAYADGLAEARRQYNDKVTAAHEAYLKQLGEAQKANTKLRTRGDPC